MVMLLALAACGAADQEAAQTTPAAGSSQETAAAQATDAPTSAARPTEATLSQPTDQPAPTAIPTKPAPSPIPPEPPNPTVAVTISPAPPAPAPPTAAPAAPDAWQTYRSEQAGYAVDYPAAWTASEQTGTGGSLVTTFMPSGDGAGITIIVMPGGPHQEGADMPNTRCQDVTIGGLSGKRCVDTLTFGISTTIAGKGRTYTIATSGKGTDRNVYQRLLDSFRAIS